MFSLNCDKWSNDNTGIVAAVSESAVTCLLPVERLGSTYTGRDVVRAVRNVHDVKVVRGASILPLEDRGGVTKGVPA